MGFRILILAAMGLGALYMMHLLAQDYDRIRRPITKAIERALRGKRDVDTNELSDVANITVDWKNIMDHDQFDCLQSLICQLMSGAQIKDNEAIMFTQFLNVTYDGAPQAITLAYDKGLAYQGDTDRCYEEYPYCWYSAKAMLRILSWFT